MLKKIQKIFKPKQTHLSAIDSTNNNDENFNKDKHPIRFGTLFLLIGLGGFLLWACLAPLNEGVPCQGSISIDTKRKIIQHLGGGVIKNIYIKEGQFVKANDVLLTFSDTTVKARLEDTRQH